VVDDLKVKISRTSDVRYSIILHNSAGQKIWSTTGTQTTGTRITTIPMKQYSRGIYHVSVLFDNKKVVGKKILRN
jgi:hypothetical protein